MRRAQRNTTFTVEARWVPVPASITARTPGLSGRAERGDWLGSTLVDNFVGVPYEDVGKARDAGAVCALGLIDVIRGRSIRAPGRCISQNSRQVQGRSEAGDHFGASLTQFDPARDEPPLLFVIGSPGEDVGRASDQGLVQIATADIGFPYVPHSSVRTLPIAGPQTGARWGTELAPPH
ncbi:MAG TPA: hypothetical protein VFP89_02835 [Propionibacteriaceae bacterium]|nr:hypothetical protein [Propionibacteriaceae bacterium]